MSGKATVDVHSVTSAPLSSAANYIGEACRQQNDNFMRCKATDRNPDTCIKEGDAVSACVREVLSGIVKNCEAEYKKHWNCLDRNNQSTPYCRTEERALAECVFAKMGLGEERVTRLREGNEASWRKLH